VTGNGLVTNYFLNYEIFENLTNPVR
jgi:hypothetical protein